jgi:hypothetical protein
MGKGGFSRPVGTNEFAWSQASLQDATYSFGLSAQALKDLPKFNRRYATTVAVTRTSTNTFV